MADKEAGRRRSPSRRHNKLSDRNGMPTGCHSSSEVLSPTQEAIECLESFQTLVIIKRLHDKHTELRYDTNLENQKDERKDRLSIMLVVL